MSDIEALCQRYVNFGLDNPRLYEAMFVGPTTLIFATVDTPSEVRASFEALRDLMVLCISSDEADSAAELLWAACHGIVTLHAAGRIPGDRIDQHVAQLARM